MPGSLGNKATFSLNIELFTTSIVSSSMLMKILTKAFVLAIVLTVFWTFKEAYASDFSNAYIVTYEVASNSETTVTQNLTITNLSQKIYATDYTISISH